jgi:hypothetical protein
VYPLGALAGVGPIVAWLFIAHHLGIGDSWPAWLRLSTWLVLFVTPGFVVSWMWARGGARRARGYSN